MISRIAQQVLIWSLILFVLVWGYLPFLWNMNWPALTLIGLAAVSAITWTIVGLANLRNFFAQRSSQFGTGLVVMTIGVVGLLIAINYTAHLKNRKKDITVSKLYSLSDQSKKIAREIKEEISVEVWTTNAERMSPNQDIKKFLENYKIESGGKISVAVKNPNEDLSVKERNVTKDNVILFRASSGRESRIENVNQEKIEEQVTNALVQAVKGVRKMVCFTNDHGEHSIDSAEKNGLSSLKQSLEGSAYQTKSLSIGSIKSIPAECEAVVVAGPQSEPTENGFNVIKAYMQSNGKTLLLFGATTPAKWNELIKPYGVEVRNDVILDVNVQPPTVVVTQNFGRSVEIVKSFDRRVALPQSSSLSIPTSGRAGEFEIKTFVFSEAHTFAKKNSPGAQIRVQPSANDMKGPLAIAALVENPAAKPSGDADGGMPPGIEQIHDEQRHDHGDGHDHGMLKLPRGAEWLGIREARAEVKTPAATPASAQTPEASKTKIIVIGSNFFAANAFVHQVGNLDLFMNSIAYLLEDHDVIGIRPRQLKATRLQLSSETDRQVQATVYLLAGLCFLGALRASRRRKMSV